MLDSSLQIHKNGAYILLADHIPFKNVYPANKAISDVAVFFNTILINRLKENKLQRKENDTVILSKIEFFRNSRES